MTNLENVYENINEVDEGGFSYICCVSGKNKFCNYRIHRDPDDFTDKVEMIHYPKQDKNFVFVVMHKNQMTIK